MSLRIGHGYDIHRLVPGRAFVIAGIHLDAEVGPEGHSDGDVLAHAVIDALLGATGNNDIGTHFPAGDETWRDASGALLVERCLEIIAGYRIVNVDATIITETPRLAPYRDRIRSGLASMLDLPVTSVNVKAKTNEGCDEVGASRAVACHVVVLLEPHGEGEDEVWL